MFERFTDRARRVVVMAQEEARLLNHNYIGTEHILLALVHEGDGVAARALQSMSISLEGARAQVEEIVGPGGTSPSGHIPFTPRAKKVLELSLREALQLGHNYIGTEHILLGLVREGMGVGAQVLVHLGADLIDVRQQVIQLMSGHSGAPKRAEEWNPLVEDAGWLAAQRRLTDETRRALERALGEAVASGAASVEPHHLFLALLGEGGGRLAEVLEEAGVDPHEIRRRLSQGHDDTSPGE